METASRPALVGSIFRQLCPRCRMGRIFRGSVFRGFPSMEKRCSICDLKFEREEGYFLGAMYISYALALATIAVLALVLWTLTAWGILKDIVVAIVLFLPLAPVLTLFSRVLWIYLDQAIDPERRI